MWRGSTTPNDPVVKRQDRFAWRFLNTGKPTTGPLRRPDFESDHAFRPQARANRPVLAASLELDRHQGATRSLAAFHSRRSAGRVQGTGTVAASASASRRVRPSRRVASRTCSRSERRPFTKARPQL